MACDVLDKKKSIDRKCLRNDSEVTIIVKEDLRSRYAKYVFLLGKNKQRDHEPSPFWAFLQT